LSQNAKESHTPSEARALGSTPSQRRSGGPGTNVFLVGRGEPGRGSWAAQTGQTGSKSQIHGAVPEGGSRVAPPCTGPPSGETGKKGCRNPEKNQDDKASGLGGAWSGRWGHWQWQWAKLLGPRKITDGRKQRGSLPHAKTGARWGGGGNPHRE